MKNNITNQNGDRIELQALTVRPFRDTKKIVTQMLDGSYSVQQTGAESKVNEISVCVSDKSELDAICASCETIHVYHFGTTYTGIISSERINWGPLLKGNNYYKGTFSLVVTE